MIIQQCRLDRGFLKYSEEYKNKACEVLDSSFYILGKEVEAFEEEFASYLGAKYCVGVGNGTDALYLAFLSLNIGKGDEVILPANAFVADYLGIVRTGATPVPVDIGDDYLLDVNKVEEKITKNTKAILAVHLYGGATDMLSLKKTASEHGLKLVEDCAQSTGTTLNGQKTGTFSDISCFSFYPTKNLGAFGDGGAVVTDDPGIAEKIKALRFYGSPDRETYTMLGTNSRLDEMQAGLLRVRLTHLDELLSERIKAASLYFSLISNEDVSLPVIREGEGHTFHQFVISCPRRDELMSFLRENGVMTKIHYPVLPYLTPAYEYLNYPQGNYPKAEDSCGKILSLPIYDGITEEEIKYTANLINRFV